MLLLPSCQRYKAMKEEDLTLVSNIVSSLDEVTSITAVNLSKKRNEGVMSTYSSEDMTAFLSELTPVNKTTHILDTHTFENKNNITSIERIYCYVTNNTMQERTFVNTEIEETQDQFIKRFSLSDDFKYSFVDNLTKGEILGSVKKQTDGEPYEILVEKSDIYLKETSSITIKPFNHTLTIDKVNKFTFEAVTYHDSIRAKIAFNGYYSQDKYEASITFITKEYKSL